MKYVKEILSIIFLGTLTACNATDGDWFNDEPPFNYINQENLQLRWRDCRAQPTCSADYLVDRF